MHATLWRGEGEAGAMRLAILQLIFGGAEVPLAIVTTQEALLAAAARSRRAVDRHILIVDCGAGEPADVERCIAVIRATTLPVHIIHPRAETVREIGRATGSPANAPTP